MVKSEPASLNSLSRTGNRLVAAYNIALHGPYYTV